VMVTPGSLQFTPRHAPRAASVFETCPAAVRVSCSPRPTHYNAHSPSAGHAERRIRAGFRWSRLQQQLDAL
jgi:hypothetical protein